MANNPHRRTRADRSKSAKDLLFAAVGSLVREIADVRSDPRRMKPGELCRVLNSTPLGDVLTTTRLAAHRQRAGLRIGDGKSVDLVRYSAWLFHERRRSVAEISREMPTDRTEVYERKRERAAQRERDKSEKGRDIGVLPPVEDPARRASCRDSLQLFCEHYFPERFKLAWSDDHLKVIQKVETAVRDGGLFAMAMPRGTGKTTIVVAASLWAILNGYRRFVAVVGSDAESAKELLTSMKTELESNGRLLADFPEACHPIVRLEGIAHRCRGQLYRGERTHIGWQKTVLIMPTIPGSAASGAIVKVAGITGRIRGMQHLRLDGQVARPDFAIVDDGQTDKSARSHTQCDTREGVVAGAILGLPEPGKKMACVMPCTVIVRGDMADRMLNRKLHPEWQGERMRLVYEWPKRQDLWDRYAEIRAEELEQDRDISKATEFYKAHRREMDEGARVAWPSRHNPDEISALQHAVNLKLTLGPKFESEYQNDPPDAAEDTELLTAIQIAAKVNGYKRGEVSKDVSHLTGFIDVHGQVLYWLVAGWASDFTGYIVDYGTWPDQRQRYFALNSARETLERLYRGTGLTGRLFAALRDLRGDLLGKRWIRDDGAEIAIERLLIDANWGQSTDTVYQSIRQAEHAALLLPTHGRGVKATEKSMNQWSKKPGEIVGLNWRIRPTTESRAKVRHGIFDTNFWKSFVHQRLAVQLGDPGCLSLYKSDHKSEHRMIGEHCRAEDRHRIEAENGRRVDEWRLKPGGPDNHFFDCLVGATVAASMQGCALKEHTLSKPRAPRRPRVRYAD